MWSVSGTKPHEIRMDILLEEFDNVWTGIRNALDTGGIVELVLPELMAKFRISLRQAFDSLVDALERNSTLHFGKMHSLRDWKTTVQPLCKKEAVKLTINGERQNQIVCVERLCDILFS